MTDTADKRKTVQDLAAGFTNAMLVTIGPGGNPKARPMHIAHIDEDFSHIWFFTGKAGELAAEIAGQEPVLLVFQNDQSAFLSLRGKARLTEDRLKISAFWKAAYQVWFPGGVNDPNIALIAVDPVDAEYWDNRGANKLSYLFRAAKAYIQGEQVDVQDSDLHAKTSL